MLILALGVSGVIDINVFLSSVNVDDRCENTLISLYFCITTVLI